MNEELLECLINIGVTAFENLLEIEIKGWDFIVVNDINEPFAMDITCAYDEKLDLIFVNPLIIKIFEIKGLPKELYIPQIMAKLGHEFRHAWQKRNPLFKEEFKNHKNVHEKGFIDYVTQPIELDAASFEECVLKALTNNMNIIVDLPYEIIHSEAKELYHIYGKKIQAEFSKYLKLPNL